MFTSKKTFLLAIISIIIGGMKSYAAPEDTVALCYDVIPMPRQVDMAKKGGVFVLTPENRATAIQTRIDKSEKLWRNDRQKSEAYELKVTKKGIDIVAADSAGLYYAFNFLQKVTDGTMAGSLPYAIIHDSPEFPYRGVHLDCSRHFFPVWFIKKYIDILALHNCNVFHWHITDDQGWRFEVKKYPRLTEVGAKRANTIIGHNLPIDDGTPHDGFYTQEECREIVRYAAERHITVMPEIDLPGHMVAALASYPELGCTGGPYEVWNMWGVHDDVLCAGNPKTLAFIKDVLSELIDVFPSSMIHLGGDECPKVRWETCPKCQAKIKALGLKAHDGLTAENQLQNWLMHEAEQFLNEHGRSMIGWDEILEGGVSATASVMSWRGQEGGIAAARTGHDVVMTPISYCYLNFYQSKNRDAEPMSFDGDVMLSKAYSIPVVPEELSEDEAKHILGCQANLWAEYIPSPQQAEWMLLPRLAALSEAQWMPAEARNYDAFLKRLPRLKQLYKKLGFYCSDKVE